MKAIDITTVTTTYNGLDGCACGCGGTYAKVPSAAATRRVNKLNRSLDKVEEFAGFEDEMIYELVEGGRVTRVYFKNVKEV